MSDQSFTLRSDLEKARASALASLAMREHSVKELSEKLQRKSYQPDSITTVIQECLQSNYLDDERFAEMYCRNRARKGFGPNKIRHELKLKGVSSTSIQQAFYQEDLDFDHVVAQAYAKKFRDAPIKDIKDKLKRQNYLYNRGFDLELIRTVID